MVVVDGLLVDVVVVGFLVVVVTGRQVVVIGFPVVERLVVVGLIVVVVLGKQ